MRKAKAERQEIILPSEFAIRSACQNVEETDSETQVCALFGYVRKERNGDLRKNRVSPAGKIGIWHCAAILFSQVPTKCTDIDLSLLYILISGIYSKFAWENNFLALGVCFPHPCSSAGRRFAASRPRLQNYRRIVSFPGQTNR